MAKTGIDLIQDQFAALQTQIAELKKKQDDLQQSLTTCSGSECDRLDKQLKASEATEAHLSAIEAGLAAKLKEATDGRLATLETKLVELGGKVDGYAKAVEQPKLNENMYFQCPEEGCLGVLDLSQDSCPVCASDDWSWIELLDSAKAAVEERRKKA